MSEVDRVRRRLIQGAVGMAVLPLLEGSVSARTIGPAFGATHPVTPNMALYDSRFAAGPEFGSVFSEQGIFLQSFEGDLTEVWARYVEPVWRDARAPLAGLTCERNLACLHELGRDHRMQLIHLARHRPDAASVTTSVYGPRGMLPGLAEASMSPGSWPQRAGRLALEVPALGERGRIARYRSHDLPGRLAAPLFSWVFAPIEMSRSDQKMIGVVG